MSSTLGMMERRKVGRDLDGLLFGTSDSKLETSDCEKFRSGKVFRAATCSSESGISLG